MNKALTGIVCFCFFQDLESKVEEFEHLLEQSEEHVIALGVAAVHVAEDGNQSAQLLSKIKVSHDIPPYSASYY